MPSDVMRDVTPQEVTPVAGKGALGTWLSHRIRTCKAGLFCGIESGSKPMWAGVYVCQRLSFAHIG